MLIQLGVEEAQARAHGMVQMGASLRQGDASSVDVHRRDDVLPRAVRGPGHGQEPRGLGCDDVAAGQLTDRCLGRPLVGPSVGSSARP